MDRRHRFIWLLFFVQLLLLLSIILLYNIRCIYVRSFPVTSGFDAAVSIRPVPQVISGHDDTLLLYRDIPVCTRET